AEDRMPTDLSHRALLAGQIDRLITISTTPSIAFYSFDTDPRALHSFPTRRSSDLNVESPSPARIRRISAYPSSPGIAMSGEDGRSEEHTSELQSLAYLVCRLLLEKKNLPSSLPCWSDWSSSYHFNYSGSRCRLLRP